MTGWAVNQRVLRFFRDFDNWNYEAMAAAFVPEGTWDRNGRILKGRPAIVTELSARPAQQVVRHVISNLVVDADGQSSAAATFLVIAYRHLGAREPVTPPVIRQPLMLLDGKAQLSCVDGAWYFENQALRRVFEFQE
jgi:SnoaL-like domain